MGIPVTGVSELVLEVVDLEASEAFYAGALGLPVVDRWPDREAIWVMAGDRTRIGLWRPQVGLEGSRGGVHVHFALHIAEDDYDSAIATLQGGRPRRPRARVQDPPALARGLRRRPRRPPRRALDLGRRRPRSQLSADAVEALALGGPPVRARRLDEPPVDLDLLGRRRRTSTPPRTLPRRRPSRRRPRRRCARPCRACRSAAARRRTAAACPPATAAGCRAAAARPRGSPGRAGRAASRVSVDPVAALAGVDACGTRSRAARRGRTCTRRSTPRARARAATAGTATTPRPSSRARP